MSTSPEIENKASELVYWTRRWMSALPVAILRPLPDAEVAALRHVFVAVLSDQPVNVDTLPVPANMKRKLRDE